MALLAKIGRTRPRVVAGIALMYALLAAGGVTMVYPYLVTLTAAMANELDYERYQPFPRFWYDPAERYLRYLAEKYADASRFEYFKSAYGAPSHWGSFRDAAFDPAPVAERFPLFGAERDAARFAGIAQAAQDYRDFLVDHFPSRAAAEGLVPLFLRYNLQSYQDFTRRRYENLVVAPPAGGATPPAAPSPASAHTARPGSVPRRTPRGRALEREALALMGRIRGDSYESYIALDFTAVRNYAYALPRWLPSQTPRHLDFTDWVRSLPPGQKLPVTRRYLWTRHLQESGWDVKRYNAAAGAALESLTAAPWPAATNGLPAELAAARREFLAERWPLRLVRLRGDHHRAAFREFLASRYPSLEAFNRIAGGGFRGWDDVPFSPVLPHPHGDAPSWDVATALADTLQTAWRDYAETVPPDEREILAPETAFQQFLLRRHGSLAAVNAAHGTGWTSVEAVELPIAEADYCDYVAHRGRHLVKSMFHNYGHVVRYMATKGRAFVNTAILVLLTLVCTLTVNPLAAYALSRFRLRATPKILLFLLATMAFPPEVAMIPSFLLLRDLGLLNTFGALVLPGLANGFSIFLLKGFFDSLPQELYDAASIDGAGELRMFATITLPLCKPILAVTALGAFLGAYGGFMWAFLVCQDPKMWTIMVWLYQFQQFAGQQPYLTMAALVLASIPTMLVFLSCQKIILRGIIIPTMK